MLGGPQETGYYPASPEPVRIDRFIEKQFKVTPFYEDDLPPGVIGYTEFSKNGVSAIVISRSLEEDESRSAQRRVRTTLAHEGGHGLLHAHLFALERQSRSLFDAESRCGQQILCRDVPIGDGHAARPKPFWSEFQANAAIGGLLLPRRLVAQVVAPYLVTTGSFGRTLIDPASYEAAIGDLSETFDVNPIVARIRLEALHGHPTSSQLAF